jgi:autotransporter-associated beta strand protein
MNSSAGNAQFAIAGADVPGCCFGGGLTFNSSSTNNNATIVANGGTVAGAEGAKVFFINGSHAGTSTITANGGTNGGNGATITFSNANGDTSRIIANAGSTVDFVVQPSYNNGTTSVGSIEGAGSYLLRGSHLISGARNLSTTVSGPIKDNPNANPYYSGGRFTKVGTGTLTLAGTNTYTGATTVNAGMLRITGSVAGDVVVNAGGKLRVAGAVGGKVIVNGGDYSPGSSPGTSTIGGLTINPGGTLDFEIGDTARDRIVLTGGGNISLGGTLKISLLDGFAPALGQSFSLFEGAIGSITGAFDSIIAPTFNGQTLNLMLTANSILLQVGSAPFLAGDYNGNGAVDAADYALWRNHLGSSNSLLNDDTPGVAQDDYTRWRANFGRTSGSGTAASSASARGTVGSASPSLVIPEPASFLLILLAATGWFVVSGRRNGR